ncbi:hypothetical protein, partial [Pseudomonas aeruginosa]|uniref:hypothetical protein n=3 Tax=Pseudomonas aeruginosa TaxID=287 RepID=UPI00280D45B7|nr:hypothetical protein [Pseudomonas aeruginosa]
NSTTGYRLRWPKKNSTHCPGWVDHYKAIKRLDRFSKNLELSRARILEILLQMEDEKDLYLKEQIRVLRGIEL